jgi:hypothetical protein
MKPTPHDEFIQCGILPNVVASTCLNSRGHTLTAGQADWFIKHVDTRVRWLHANNVRWRRSLDRGDRDQLYVWVHHWLEAYLRGPVTYQERHPMEAMQ